MKFNFNELLETSTVEDKMWYNNADSKTAGNILLFLSSPMKQIESYNTSLLSNNKDGGLQ